MSFGKWKELRMEFTQDTWWCSLLGYYGSVLWQVEGVEDGVHPGHLVVFIVGILWECPLASGMS